MAKNDDRIRIQITVSPAMLEYLERLAIVRGQPLGTVATALLADRMVADIQNGIDDIGKNIASIYGNDAG